MLTLMPMYSISPTKRPGEFMATRPPHNPQRGFTLVEILVTLVVLSIGLLGVAGLQLNGLRQSKSSLQVTQATAFAYALADMMRANKAGATNYVQDVSAFNTQSAPAKNCNTASCTPSELAAFDTYYWFHDYTFTDASSTSISVPGLKSVLGTSAAAWVLCQDAACNSTSVYRIGVFWDRNRVPATGTLTYDCMNGTYNNSDPNELACVVISVQL